MTVPQWLNYLEDTSLYHGDLFCRAGFDFYLNKETVIWTYPLFENGYNNKTKQIQTVINVW